MGIGFGALKGAALGILYAVIAAPPFALVYFHFKGWGALYGLLPLVAACSVPAGALVGAAVVLTGANRRGRTWRAQLAMLVIYVLTGIAFFGKWGNVPSILEGLKAAVVFSPVFVPLGLLATWVAVRWIRRSTPVLAGRGVTLGRVHS